MDKNRYSIIAIIIAMIVAGIFWWSYDSLQDLTDVVVAAGDIDPRTPVTPNLVKKVKVPSGGKHAQAIVNPDELIGQYSTTKIFAGEQIIKPMISAGNGTDPLSLASAIPNENLRAVPIPLDDYTSLAGKLKKGDKIDIIATFKKDDGLNAVLSKTIRQNVEVFDVGSSSKDGKNVALLLLRPDDAELVMFAHRTGQLVFTLTPVNARANYPTTGVTVPTFFQSFGFIVK